MRCVAGVFAEINGQLSRRHLYTYRYTLVVVKKRDLEKTLKALGWWKSGDAGPHEKWTNGVITRPVPRHNEINEYTARGIIKIASENPPLPKEEKKK